MSDEKKQEPAVKEDVAKKEPPAAPAEPPEIKLASPAEAVHDALEKILRERRVSWPKAVARNAYRLGGRLSRVVAHVVTGTSAAVAVMAATGDLMLAVTVGSTVGVGTPPVLSTLRLRRRHQPLLPHGRRYPNVAEFRDLWAVTAYEFMLMVRGYRLRAEAVQRLRSMADQLTEAAASADRAAATDAAAAAKKEGGEKAADEASAGNVRAKAEELLARAVALHATADGIVALLATWHPGLMTIDRTLSAYQPGSMERPSSEEDQETLRLIQPLQHGRFDWLILEPEVILPGRELEQLERDRREIASFQDVLEHLDPYGAMARNQPGKT